MKRILSAISLSIIALIVSAERISSRIRQILLLFTLGSLQIISSCTKEETDILPIPIESVQITVNGEKPKDVFNLQMGDTIRLGYKIFPENASFVRNVWTNSDPNILEIDYEKGIGIMKKPGVVQIGLQSYYENEQHRHVSVDADNIVLIETILPELEDFDVICQEYPSKNQFKIKNKEVIHLGIQTYPKEVEIIQTRILNYSQIHGIDINSDLILTGQCTGGKTRFTVQIIYYTPDYQKQSATQEVEITCGEFIQFEDPEVEKICLNNWDTDRNHFLSYEEAAAVKTIDEHDFFSLNKKITRFNELQYFTGLETIDDFAFWECRKLQSIILPDHIKTIGLQAFCLCTQLEPIHLPETLEVIDTCAFMQSGKALSEKNLQLPSLKFLGPNAIGYNPYIEIITIGEHIEEIDFCPLWDCENVKEIRFTGTQPPIGGAMWGKDLIIRVPAEAVEKYNKRYYFQKTGEYKNYITEDDIIVPDEEITYSTLANRVTEFPDWEYMKEDSYSMYTYCKKRYAEDPWYFWDHFYGTRFVYLKEGIYLNPGNSNSNRIMALP